MTPDPITAIYDYDEEIYTCQQQLQRARSCLFDRLSEAEKTRIFVAARRVIVTMRESNPRLNLTTFDLIDAVLSAQYFARFGESPIETALKARHNR